MASEVWQFLIVIAGFLVVALFWLLVVYVPGRTLERWEDQRSGRGDEKPPSPADPESLEGPSTRPTANRALDCEQ